MSVIDISTRKPRDIFEDAPELETFLALAQAGFHLIRLHGKAPIDTAWPGNGTRDEAVIRRWHDAGHNVGIDASCYGDDPADHLFVLDLDVTHGTNGVAALADLEQANELLPETYRQITASGGEHRVYVTKAAIGNAPIARGVIDIRGVGGQIVAAGSSINGKPYTAPNGIIPPVEAPGWILALCRKKAAASVAIKLEKDALDKLTARQDGIEIELTTWLGAQNVATPGELRNKAFEWGAECKNRGLIDYVTAIALVTDHGKFEPMLDHLEIEEMVLNAYGNGNVPFGNKTAEGMFAPIVAPAASNPLIPAPRQIPYSTFASMKPDLRRRKLVRGFLKHETVSMFYGPWGMGKSFLVGSMLFHIAMGWDWFGRKVDQGATIYVSTEGGYEEAANRVEALKRHYGVTNVPMALVTCPIDLGGVGADVDPMIDLAKRVQDDFGQNVNLTAYDTLSGIMNGGDEDKASSMNGIIRNCTKINQAVKMASLIVHHPGKDSARGPRGNYAMAAGLDMLVKVDDGWFDNPKQRGMKKEEARIWFDLVDVDLGADEDGEPNSSKVAVPRQVQVGAAVGDVFGVVGDLEKRAADVLQAFRNIGTPTSKNSAREEYRRINPIYAGKRDQRTVKNSGQAFKAGLDILLKRNMIVADGDLWRVATAPDA